jgi:hypothetical protein
MSTNISIDKSIHNFLKDVSDDVLALDEAATIIYLNHDLQRVPRKSLIGQSMMGAIAPLEQARFSAMLERVFQKGEIFSFEMNFENCFTKESHWYFCRLSPLKKRGKAVAALLFTTHLAETERSLKAHRHLMAELEKARREIRSLKKMVTMCAWTGKVKLDGRWVRVEEFLNKKYGVEVSHGISEEAVAIMESRMARGV